MHKHPMFIVSALALLAACTSNPPATEQAATPPATEATTAPALEPVFADSTYQLTGVAATPEGRVFVNYPYWLDTHHYSLVEVGPDGTATPYPDAAWNSFKKGDDGRDKFVCVQAVVADDAGSLWVVDPAGIGLGKVYQKSNKVVQIDLKTNQVKRIYRFPETVAGVDSYLNDIRVDNENSFAYLTSSSKGGLVVLDLGTGKSRQVLQTHPSTQADPAYHFRPGGQPELANAQGPVKINSDGIALSPDKAWLYYKPLTDNQLYRVPTAALRDFSTSEKQVEQQVESLGRFVTTDGMAFDAAGNLYLGDLEKSSIVRLSPDKQLTTLVTDTARLSWPDSYSISGGYLYITSSQIHRMPWFNQDRNQTRLPYQVFRLKLK